MKKIALIAVIIALTGCAVPVTQKFPVAPDSLKDACTPLQVINSDTITLSDFTKSVSSNYMLFNQCSTKTDAWIEWYNTQKKIFDAIQ